jgi:hypothetical protein
VGGAHGVGVEADVGGGGQQICVAEVVASGLAQRRPFRCKEAL